MLPKLTIDKGRHLVGRRHLEPNLGLLKGNTRRRTPSCVTLNTCHRNVTLAVDTMYINGMTFMITTSSAIHFGKAELIKYEKTTSILTALRQLINAYQAIGFKMPHILGNG